jgi:hypothetical protein
MTDFVDQQIIGPRRATITRERFARERLAAAKHKRRIAKPSKAHATNKERSQQQRARARELAHTDTQRRRDRAAFLQASREYWAGARECHP